MNEPKRPDDTAQDEQAQRLEQRARALLADSAERLDARTRSRLTQARHAALEAADRAQRSSSWFTGQRYWMPAGGLAVAAVLAVAISLWPGRGVREGEPTLLDDFDLVADAENLEMLQDVEFYTWLAAELPADDAAGELPTDRTG